MMLLSEAAHILSVPLCGTDHPFTSVSHDTRTLEPGALYVAIEGDAHDGHAFVSAAKAQGAVGALVSKLCDVELPQLVVPDTTASLAALGKAYRSQFSDLKVAAITGSCGKTTTRALLESIYSQCGPTLASVKSFNNIWGVPLTLLRLKPEHQYLVAELGANHRGEIAPLVALVQPQASVVLNVAPTHLEGFGSLDAVADTKGAIYDTLPDAGVAVINADDHYAETFKARVGDQPVLYFGMEHAADVMAKNIVIDANARPSFDLTLSGGESCTVTLQLIGRHQVYNALAAAALALASGCSLDAVQKGLESARAVANRMNAMQLSEHVVLINDSYNANPKATCASIDVLTHYPGQSLLVFGDMVEMGEEAQQWHAEVGAYARASGVSSLFCYGPLSRATCEAFGEGATHFETQEAMISALKVVVQQQEKERLTVLVKGSNGMKMVRVVKGLTAEFMEG